MQELLTSLYERGEEKRGKRGRERERGKWRKERKMERKIEGEKQHKLNYNRNQQELLTRLSGRRGWRAIKGRVGVGEGEEVGEIE